MLQLLFLTPLALAQCVDLVEDVPSVITLTDESSPQYCYTVGAEELAQLYMVSLPCIGRVDAFVNINAEARASSHKASRQWADGSDTTFFRMGLPSLAAGSKVYMSYTGQDEHTVNETDMYGMITLIATQDDKYLDNYMPSLPNGGNMEVGLLEGGTAEVSFEWAAPSSVQGAAVDVYTVWTRSGYIDDRDENPILGCGLEALFEVDEDATATLSEAQAAGTAGTATFEVEHPVTSDDDPPFFIAVQVSRTYPSTGVHLETMYRYQRIGNVAVRAATASLGLLAVALLAVLAQ